MKNGKTTRGKWFTFLLYPECNAHRDILNYLLDDKVQEAQKFRVAGILHDKDVYSEGVKKGMLKKPHVHVIMNTENRHTAPAIAKMMGGQRTVLRLYQRDAEHEHSTTLSLPKKKNNDTQTETEGQSITNSAPDNSKQEQEKGITRTFHHKTGDEYPVLVDMGYGELQPVDLDVPPNVWDFIATPDGHHWDSLPKYFYDNPNFPQFRCAKNQYWKLVTRQDVSHAEVIADPLAYYLYLQHKDLASVRNGKAQYPETDFFGNQELLAKLRGERGVRYQVSQVIEYFSSCGVTNGKDALESLLYGDCTNELFDFYWKNTSKFNAYFRALELEANQNQVDVPEDNSEDESSAVIDYTHKHQRELKEHIHECDTKTAKRLSKEYEAIVSTFNTENRTESIDRNRLHEIEEWFAQHKDQKLFSIVSPEEQLFNDNLRKCIMDYYKTSEPEQDVPEQSKDCSPSSALSSAPSSASSSLADMDTDVAALLGIKQIL